MMLPGDLLTTRWIHYTEVTFDGTEFTNNNFTGDRFIYVGQARSINNVQICWVLRDNGRLARVARDDMKVLQ
jgi:hypothetical protein